MARVFFTSDWHLNHARMISHAKRPFRSVSEMNAALIHNFNSMVGPRDDVWFLGDFVLGEKRFENAKAFLEKIRGKKHMILGNHDPRTKEFFKLFDSCAEYREIKVEGQRICLFHYATRVWNRSHRGSWMLYGHSHGSLPDDPTSRSIDVCVDCHNYFPISFDEVTAIIATKSYAPVDHHRETEDEGDE